ncbi:hypothetical protein H0I54_02895 [Yersinia kristensenii]|uniref:helix-turn-helix domain-containing protein n=1 Tax=Yersinia kristensenii TaxID=28152 RepID=UPI00124AA7E0|nr:helix-turn-helix domain-containing protein [Yersinia kristensenii]MBW5840757.1 hypothetical protein [Yersinia kristensenii]
MSVTEFIIINFGGNKAAFARHMGVTPQQVTKWVNDEWIVVGNKLYAPRREVPKI